MGYHDDGPSSWRLVNMALGLASLLTVAGAMGFPPGLTTIPWLLTT